MSRTLLALCLLAPLAACISPAQKGIQEDGTAQSDSPAEGKQLDPEELRAAQLEIAELSGDLQEAQLELRSQEHANATSQLESERAVLEADRELTEARDALARYREVEGPLLKAKAQLEVEGAANRLEAARQDLEGILEIYEGEEEARAKQEIIRRNRKSVEIAQKVLENERTEARMVVEFEFPQQVRHLEWELDNAENAQKVAQRALEAAQMEGEAKRVAAENRITSLQAKLEAKRAELNGGKESSKP
ncbi:MAG: hypothetical protein H6830_09955 [Planctomycetes bacterium]|nr:hypothetical protein [Planctomycetota bacterium]MCB9909437.1 hypothetical protein [Planctomycetota bacterium]HRV81760.1 hypothetical protein [Planctomycetota bacterium]